MANEYNSIQAAINFLKNPSVQKRTDKEKAEFLRSKGFSNEDIVRAFEDTSHDFTLETTKEATKFHSKQRNQWSINSFLDNFTSLAVVGGLFYGAYTYLERYFNNIKRDDDNNANDASQPKEFAKNDEKVNQLNTINKSAEIICKLQNRMTDISNTVQSMNENIHKLEVVPTKINAMHNEINEIRTLLLNRNQFPKAPEIFPAWQKPSTETAETQNSNSLYLPASTPNKTNNDEPKIVASKTTDDDNPKDS